METSTTILSDEESLERMTLDVLQTYGRLGTDYVNLKNQITLMKLGHPDLKKMVVKGVILKSRGTYRINPKYTRKDNK